MKTVFVDACYWVAIANPKDPLRKAALKAKESLGDKVRRITTDEVLVEFLNFLSDYGEYLRKVAVSMVKEILANPNVKVVGQTHISFEQGLKLYENRIDKSYSLTDCISINTMNAESITEALSHDKHFEQEGFHKLMV
jgi:predicted nucleic acid-binding protein